MGSFVFTWPNAAEEVFVTGTFDNWSKSVKLDKVGDVFQKSVELADASTKIDYKFVVDGNWVIDPAAPKEADEHGNENNILTPDKIVTPSAAAAIISSAAPESTTAALAKDVPLEATKTETPEVTPAPPAPAPVEETPVAAAVISSAAPESTTAELVKDVPLEAKETPAAAATDMSSKPEDMPGALPETPASDLDKEVKMINPLPAAPGGVNPIKLAPGEKIPESLTSADPNANVKLDPESYEKADAAIAGEFSADQLPPVTKNMIPESSLPIAGANDVTISSVAPTATTAALAGAVPLEKDKAVEAPTVPEVVRQSQEAAGASPEASAVPEEVKEKAEVEEELLKKVPEAPAASEGSPAETKPSVSDTIGDLKVAAAGLGAAAVATAMAAKDKAIEEATPMMEKATAAFTDAASKLPESVKDKLPESVREHIPTPTAETPAAVNGTDAAQSTPAPAATAPVAAPAAPASPSVEKKKKHRVSGFFKKIFDKKDGKK